MFVAEDADTHEVVGTSSIVSKVGGFQPFYNYKLEKSVHDSPHLGVHKEVPTLHLVADHNGPAEIGGLFLRPDYRKDQNGRLLSLSRFLFMAQHPHCFDPTVVAELRGVIDDQGQSPFWNALGRHFFDVELPKADYLSSVDKRFIADLMPRHPIYIPLLPEDAQNVIGKVHKNTEPALHLLTDEGFTESGMVDIFDAGPTLKCKMGDIRSVRLSTISAVKQLTQQISAQKCLIYRIDQGSVSIALNCESAKILNIDQGQNIRWVSIK
jgi:arginine N-succinyltransferase